MPTPKQCMDMSASLMNDTAKEVYTNEAQLPYFNMALQEFQEVLEQNDIPSTHETSDVINVPSGTSRVGFTGAVQLPPGLIEIKQLWESPEGQNIWTKVDKKNFLPQYLIDNTQINQFLIYAWEGNEIRFIPANQDNDIKIDYIRNIFQTPLILEQVNQELGLKYKNIVLYLGYQTAALCSMFIGENPTRAEVLATQAGKALDRSLGIAVKGQQSIMSKRRPFRLGWKTARLD